MQTLKFRHMAKRRLSGKKQNAIIGVVASGNLEVLLERVLPEAAYYHRELEVRVKHFTSLFEPAVIIVMGAVVGFVAIALVSAMYGIYRQVKS